MTNEQADKLIDSLGEIRASLKWIALVALLFAVYQGCSNCTPAHMTCDAAHVGDQYVRDDRLLECVLLRRSSGEATYRVVAR